MIPKFDTECALSRFIQSSQIVDYVDYTIANYNNHFALKALMVSFFGINQVTARLFEVGSVPVYSLVDQNTLREDPIPDSVFRYIPYEEKLALFIHIKQGNYVPIKDFDNLCYIAITHLNLNDVIKHSDIISHVFDIYKRQY